MPELRARSEFVNVTSVAKLAAERQQIVRAGGLPILLMWQEGRVRAVDNRCPHMGYPLSKGSVCDGIIRCPWHHFRYDLDSGGCLTGGPYDLPVFPVEIRDGRIWVKPVAAGSAPEERLRQGRDRLRLGLEQNDIYVIAKAVADVEGAGMSVSEIIALGAVSGIRLTEDGFGPGVTVLTALGNVMDVLDDPEDRVLALTHGIAHTARGAFGRPMRRPQRALPPGGEHDLEQLRRWFRSLIEDRVAAGAERVLRTAA
ncbi:MAG: Rieske 2Fe-2S domain-containing protein [Thermaerobacterales bacterium]